MNAQLKSKLTKVKQVLDHSPPEVLSMASKKNAAAAAPAPVNTAGKPAKVEKVKVEDDPNLVRLADLVKEAKTTGQAARRKLRSKDLARSGRWAWAPASAELKAAREALGLPN